MSKNTLPPLIDRAMDYISALDINRRVELSEFLRVKPQTVRAYHKGKSVPHGRRALSLHYIMEWAGYGDHRWTKVNDNADIVGRALAFGVVSEDGLVEAFKEECDELSRIVQMLVGQKHISPASQQIIDNLAAVHSWHIKAAQDKWDNLRISCQKEKLIAELANKLTRLLPLVKDMASDKWSESDRYQLRDRAGKSTVFDLYNIFGQLAGERQRRLSMAEKAERAAASMVLDQQ